MRELCKFEGIFLAPSVSGSLLGYTWYLVVAVQRDSIGISSLSCVTARCG